MATKKKSSSTKSGSTKAKSSHKRTAKSTSKKSTSQAKSKSGGGRCWAGYKPVKGKKPFTKGSCEKA